jgi:DNA-binding XRE family transcriptional regulator
MPKKDDPSNADLMKEWRRLMDYNTAKAGKFLGLSPRSVEDIEQGRTRVDDVLTREGLLALIHDATHEYECRTSALAALAERERKRATVRK